MTRALPLLLLAACAAPAEWTRPYPGFLPGSDRGVAFVVIDRLTGDPVEGARVRQHVEAWPTPDGTWAGIVAERSTDRYGVACFGPVEVPGAYHWAVSAEGYAPVSELGPPQDGVFELERGESWHGRIVGPFGKPVAGALVEHKLGCAHAPALAATRTDADGYFRFDGVLQGDWPWFAKGLQAEYGIAGPADLPPPVQIGLPTVPIEGRILLADGSVPEDAVVFHGASARGPLAPLGADGRFSFDCGNPAIGFTVYADEIVDVDRAYRRGGPLTHRIGADPERHDRPLTVTAAHDVPIVVERVVDGRVWSARTNERFFLPDGRYRVSTGDPFARFAGEAGPFEPGREVPLPLKKQPRLEVDWGEDEVSMDAFARLHVEGRATTWDRIDSECHLPAEGRAVLYVAFAGAHRFFEVGPVRDGVRRVAVRMPGEKYLVVDGLDVDSRYEVYGSIRDATLPEENRIRTRATGRIVVEVEESDVRIRRFEYELGEEASDLVMPVRVRTFPLPPARRLRVLGPGGEPVAYAYATVYDDAVAPPWRRGVGEWYECDEDGTCESPWFRDGTPVLVRDDDLVELRTVLRGDGPYEIRWGSASIRIDGPGPPVWLDGRMARRPLLRGLRPGPHELIVGRPDGSHVAMRIVLQEGEERRVSAERPRRPIE